MSHAPDHSCCQAGASATPTDKVPATPAGTIYTCPMHPQVRQVGPGHCPICGMALEPEMPTEHEDEGTLAAVRRKFWMALALAAPVVVIAMTPHVLDLALSM